MEKGSTLFLKGVIASIGAAVLVLTVYALFAIKYEEVGAYLPILIGMYLSAIPFIAALYQGMKLLSYIDRDQAFSDKSVLSLKHIKYYALSIGGLYTLGMPYIYLVAEQDDAPGVILMGLLIVFAALVVTTFAAVLQKVLQNAIEIKSENDLTV